MAGGGEAEDNPVNINVVPMVDVIFCLCVFFMCSFKIKQLEGEQIMVEVGSPSTVYTAQGFDIDAQTITAPTLGNWEDPAIGTKPTITAAPLYVAGVRQGS